jgi:NAD-reducing hydrogenase small subunit
MSFLDIDERLIDAVGLVDIVYSPVADIKKFPENVDVTLVEGAVCNSDHIRDAHEIRERSKVVISFGDCAVTGNVPSMRNRLDIKNVLSEVYAAGPGAAPPDQGILDIMPVLLDKVVPLHQIIPVDIYLPGCPPDPERIWAALIALLKGEPVVLPPEMRSFG